MHGRTGQVVFLIDEVESHLHPKWQFSIVGSVLRVMQQMAPSAQVQLIAATHSPQVMASVEPLFDRAQDAWFDLDYVHDENGSDVVLSLRTFEPQGDVSNWLTSEAFDLPSARSPVVAALIDQAAALVELPSPGHDALAEMLQQLVVALNPKDGFLFRWRALAERKGLPA